MDLTPHCPASSYIVLEAYWQGKLESVFSMELEHLARNAEYGIPMTVEMEKEAETMCDYGRGLARKYAAKGRAEGLEQGLQQGLVEGRNKGRNEGIQQERNSNILGMLREKIPMETIARITKVSVEQIRELGKLNGVL